MTIEPQNVGVDKQPLTWRERHQSRLRQARMYAHTFRRNRSAMLGLGIVILFLITAAIGPSVVPYPEDALGTIHLEIKLQPPSSEHWFGTDEVGDDVFTRVIVGTRVALQIGLTLCLFSLLLFHRLLMHLLLPQDFSFNLLCLFKQKGSV